MEIKNKLTEAIYFYSIHYLPILMLINICRPYFSTKKSLKKENSQHTVQTFIIKKYTRHYSKDEMLI